MDVLEVITVDSVNWMRIEDVIRALELTPAEQITMLKNLRRMELLDPAAPYSKALN